MAEHQWGYGLDWLAFADAWRREYGPREVSAGRRPFVKLGIRPAGERAILACGTRSPLHRAACATPEGGGKCGARPRLRDAEEDYVLTWRVYGVKRMTPLLQNELPAEAFIMATGGKRGVTSGPRPTPATALANALSMAVTGVSFHSRAKRCPRRSRSPPQPRIAMSRFSAKRTGKLDSLCIFIVR
jgi:hypothetical protein